MTSAAVGRSAGSLAGVLITALALISIAPEPAYGGCSHNVRARAQRSARAPIVVLGDTSLTWRETSERPLPPVRSRAPTCTGAFCSGQPAPPLSPSAVDPQGIGLWAMLSISTEVAAPEPVFSPPDETIILPTSLGTAVYHPPRRAHSSGAY
jgi:hypothetical protein